MFSSLPLHVLRDMDYSKHTDASFLPGRAVCSHSCTPTAYACLRQGLFVRQPCKLFHSYTTEHVHIVTYRHVKFLTVYSGPQDKQTPIIRITLHHASLQSHATINFTSPIKLGTLSLSITRSLSK